MRQQKMTEKHKFAKVYADKRFAKAFKRKVFLIFAGI